MLDDDYGYLRISNFQTKTTDRHAEERSAR